MDLSLIFALAPVLARHTKLVSALSAHLPDIEKLMTDVQDLLAKPEYTAVVQALQANTPEIQQLMGEVETVLQQHYSPQPKGA